jgi:hypothetical protein
MTDDEIRTVASIMLTADGECFVCAARLLVQLDKAFPGHEAAIEESWTKEYSAGSWRTYG